MVDDEGVGFLLCCVARCVSLTAMTVQFSNGVID